MYEISENRAALVDTGTEARSPVCWASSSVSKMTFEAPPQNPKAAGVIYAGMYTCGSLTVDQPLHLKCPLIPHLCCPGSCVSGRCLQCHVEGLLTATATTEIPVPTTRVLSQATLKATEPDARTMLGIQHRWA